MYIFVLSKNKVKLGGLEVPFKKNSFGKKNNYQWCYLYIIPGTTTFFKKQTP